MRTQLSNTFENIVSLENLLSAWPEFIRGKRQKPDVQKFGFHLIENLTALHRDLACLTYRHGDTRKLLAEALNTYGLWRKPAETTAN